MKKTLLTLILLGSLLQAEYVVAPDGSYVWSEEDTAYILPDGTYSGYEENIILPDGSYGPDYEYYEEQEEE